MVKKFKAYTPSRRFMIVEDFSDITRTQPEKSLVVGLKKTAGRNNKGRVTVRWRGGGHKRLYRKVDFKGYDKAGILARVKEIEYDPNRTARIALLVFKDGEKRYVLGWKGVKVGDEVLVGEEAPIKDGNRKQLKDIPDGVNIFNLEVVPWTKGKLIRGAGMYGLVMGRDEDGKKVLIKMPSGEIRKFDSKCWATIGIVGNEQHGNVVIGKAGRQRWLGRKPRVLGINMNPVDHPHGGGEGHSPIGIKKGQKSFSGKRVAAGMKTRKNKKWSNKFIVSDRRNSKK